MREHLPHTLGIAKAVALLVASCAALPACGSDSSSGAGSNAGGAANAVGDESPSGASNGGASNGGASNGGGSNGGASSGSGGASSGSGGASSGSGGANAGGRSGGNGGALGGGAGGGTSSGGAAAGRGGVSGGAGGSAGAPGAGGANGDAGTPKTIDHLVTFYGWPDNDPPGNGIAYPTLHRGAGGTGTYADPITFATDPTEWAPGTILYVPFLKRYVIMEDSCADCITDWKSKKYHIDLWLNSDGRLDSQVLDCEDAHTKSKTPVEIDPPPNRPVDATPLFDPNTGVCEPL